MIHTGDCLDVMPTLEPESIAAVVTDPPYGLGFMGKAWDKIKAERQGRNSVLRAGGQAQFDWQPSAFQVWCEAWAIEAFRVAKPGAHLLAFGGTRTYHRLAAAIEDAGWEIRDCLVWAYASGFPKSHNLDGEWDGWGTALKPAWEPIVMARKPLRGTVAANAQEHGTGALNIDGTRIGFDGDADLALTQLKNPGRHGETVTSGVYGADRPQQSVTPAGRWPANIILTDPIFDGGIAGVVGGGETTSGALDRSRITAPNLTYGAAPAMRTGIYEPDSGTYSRFFLIPKADRAEREPIAGSLAKREREGTNGTNRPMRVCEECGRMKGGAAGNCQCGSTAITEKPLHPRANVHPTVKPVDLMRHLVRLVTPPGGTVLDPFLGSGTTGIACEMEGFPWIGIEREPEYVAIAEARLIGVQKGFGLGDEVA